MHLFAGRGEKKKEKQKKEKKKGEKKILAVNLRSISNTLIKKQPSPSSLTVSSVPIDQLLPAAPSEALGRIGCELFRRRKSLKVLLSVLRRSLHSQSSTFSPRTVGGHTD